jgi:hypothetical protein
MKNFLIVWILTVAPLAAETPEVAEQLAVPLVPAGPGAGEGLRDAQDKITGLRDALSSSPGAGAAFDGARGGREGASMAGEGAAPRLVVEKDGPMLEPVEGELVVGEETLSMGPGNVSSIDPPAPVPGDPEEEAARGVLGVMFGAPRDCASFFGCMGEAGRMVIAAPLEGGRRGGALGRSMGRKIGGTPGAYIGEFVGTAAGVAVGAVLAPIGVIKNVFKAFVSLFS